MNLHWRSYISNPLKTAWFSQEIRFPNQFRVQYEKVLITYSRKHVGKGRGTACGTVCPWILVATIRINEQKQNVPFANSHCRLENAITSCARGVSATRNSVSIYVVPEARRRACARSCCSLWRTHVCNYSARLPKCFLKRAFQDGGTTSTHDVPACQLLFRGTFIDVIFAESHHGNNAIVRMSGSGRKVPAFSWNVNESHVSCRRKSGAFASIKNQ